MPHDGAEAATTPTPSDLLTRNAVQHISLDSSVLVPASPNPASKDLRRAALEVLKAHPSLPLPGGGHTLERWRELASIAGIDVCLIKVLEAHYDALAIVAELGEEPPSPDVLLAVWAAEPPDARLAFWPGANALNQGASVDGNKAWCSGADVVDQALITCHVGEQQQLARVAMTAPGIARDDSVWQAVGMARVVSGRVHFSNVPARAVGAPGAYLDRPGFWHGGAGIAACWWGAAVAIAEPLRRSPRIARDMLAAAHLGAIDVALSAVRDMLVQTASAIDAAPERSHQRRVLRLRSLTEQACSDVIQRVGRALGPGPLCQDRAHAQRCADLAVFLRQSHAERDWAALGQAVSGDETPWTL